MSYDEIQQQVQQQVSEQVEILKEKVSDHIDTETIQQHLKERVGTMETKVDVGCLLQQLADRVEVVQNSSCDMQLHLKDGMETLRESVNAEGSHHHQQLVE